MHLIARVPLLACIALLGACASDPSYTPRGVSPVVLRSAAPGNNQYSQYSQASSPQADDVLMRAIGLVGTPYRWGGNTPDSGFDCSGLIGYVYRDAAGITLPRTTRELIVMRAPNVNINDLQSGDLVFFATEGRNRVSHAGIYVGEGRFVHAPQTGGTVKLDSLDKPYWQKAYLNAKRVIQTEHLAGNP